MIELAPKRPDESLLIQRGELPVLITVQHDGVRELNNGLLVPTNSLRSMVVERNRDLGTRELSKEIYNLIEKESGDKRINRIYQRVSRSKMTHPFHQRLVGETINTLQKCCAINPLVLHIDLHGFGNQPPIGEFDLILGTNHRKTVKKSSVDKEFADFMANFGYRVYVPSKKPEYGERFGATKKSALIRQTAHAFSNVLSIQLEVEKNLRTNPVKRSLLAKHISDFLRDWIERNSNFKELGNEGQVF